jgi:alkylation response protein AidB-like acyl-CoA dehydrogenase
MNEDVTHRLIDVWATGEAAASLGFEAARQADAFDPIERAKDRLCEEQGLNGRAQLAALRKKEPLVFEYLDLLHGDQAGRESARFAELGADTLVQFSLMDARANIMNPAVKLWNTGVGATMMREAVALMGGYGTTEDCPGFLPQKWMDAQLEATYEGPEAVQRRHLTLGMTSTIFRHEFNLWIRRLNELSSRESACGPRALAAAMSLWAWTMDFLQTRTDPLGRKLYHGKRQGVTFPVADALCWLLSARQLLEDVLELKAKGPESPVLAGSIDAYVGFYADLCRVQATRAAGEASRICAALVFGFQESINESDAAAFAALRQAVDQSCAGSELARDRAAQALTSIMIPEALDYPA